MSKRCGKNALKSPYYFSFPGWYFGLPHTGVSKAAPQVKEYQKPCQQFHRYP